MEIYYYIEERLMIDLKTKLRVEKSISNSGVVLDFKKIPLLREREYFVIPQTLDGDAPKEFIGAYFYDSSNNFFKKNSNSWPRYIAKTAEKWYPVESLIEYFINKFGEELGLCMNETELVICNGQIRFLSKYFLKKNELLIHGAEICGDYLNDRELAYDIANNKSEARELFTFEFITSALDNLFKSHSVRLKKGFVKMLVFDCLIGNNDRHFYNWGVITNSKRKVKMPKFAPIYDSARGLYWNQSDEQIRKLYELQKQKNSKKIENYSKKAEPRVSCENNKKANHFELIEYIKYIDKSYEEIITTMSSQEMEDRIICRFQKHYAHFLIKERAELIESLIRLRFNKTRGL